MWQKLTTVPVLGAVFLILTALLFVQNAHLGINSNKLKTSSKPVYTVQDKNSQQLFSYEVDNEPEKVKVNKNQAKLSEATLGQNSIKRTNSTKSSIENTPKLEPKVEAITINKPAPKPIAPLDIEALIRKYAAEYGANPEVMIVIAKCESGFNANAVSPSGAYKGMYQFVTSTWQSNRRAMGLDDNPQLMFNAEEAIKTAAFKMARDGYGAWPHCSQKAFSTLALN